MSTYQPQFLPDALLRGEIGTTQRSHIQAFADAVGLAATRNSRDPAFFDVLPEKVVTALRSQSATEARDVVTIVAENPSAFSLTMPQALPYLRSSKEKVGPKGEIPIVYTPPGTSYEIPGLPPEQNHK